MNDLILLPRRKRVERLSRPASGQVTPRCAVPAACLDEPSNAFIAIQRNSISLTDSKTVMSDPYFMTLLGLGFTFGILVGSVLLTGTSHHCTWNQERIWTDFDSCSLFHISERFFSAFQAKIQEGAEVS